MGWFGKLHMNCSRRAVPWREMEEISFWYTANLLGNVLFAGKQYLAAGRMCCPVAARGGDRGHHSSVAGPYTGRQSPSSSRPSVLHKVESEENLSESPTFQSGWVRFGHLLNRGGSNLDPPSWSWASYAVSHSTEQAPVLPPLGCFANLAFYPPA